LARTTQRSLHAARLFVLLLDDPQASGVKVLLELAATRQGRKRILDALRAPEPGSDQNGGGRQLRLMDFTNRAIG
jgi:hypothetical protein